MAEVTIRAGVGHQYLLGWQGSHSKCTSLDLQVQSTLQPTHCFFDRATGLTGPGNAATVRCSQGIWHSLCDAALVYKQRHVVEVSVVAIP